LPRSRRRPVTRCCCWTTARRRRPGIEGIDRQLGKRVENGKLPADARSATSARLQAVEAIEALADCGLVIEAIVENLRSNGAVRQLEGLCGEHCILASNTSSLSITSIAARLDRPNAWSACTSSTRRR
jgi:3-hydroxybutyryl-CoA dehydrogenase